MKFGFRFMLGLVLLIPLFLLPAGCQTGDMTGGGTGGTGTGTGTITGYRSQGPAGNKEEVNDEANSNGGVDSTWAEWTIDPVLVLNGKRHLTVTEATSVRMEGLEVSIWDLIAKGSGLVASVIIAADHNPAVTQATALKVSVNHWIIGPVTATEPELSVLGQPVTVDNRTVLKGVAKASQLQVGDLVEVSGFADASNRILASRVEWRSDPVPFWKLTGPVGDFVPGTSITIGSQTVSLAGVSPANCGSGPSIGDTVEIRADPHQDFLPGAPLGGVFNVTCVSNSLEVPEHLEDSPALAEIEGMVFSIEFPMFMLGSQQVYIASETKFSGGNPENLVKGAHLLIKGLLDPNSGILFAGQIRFFND